MFYSFCFSGTEGPNLNLVIDDVKGVMLGFVKSNPDAWAPIISAVSPCL